jgi:ribonuclease inhibitor
MLDTYKYKVDFSKVENFIEIHEVLKRDLEFPEYYGGHLDALWDCLTDQLLSGITHIEIYNSEKISKKYNDEWQGIVEVLKETKHAYGDKYSNKFFVTIVHEDGTHEEIE